jgi:alpha-glucosidase
LGLVGLQITIKPQLDVLPVFVREGSILPMQPLTQSTIETPKGPLTLRVYPGKDCKGSVYLDDGLSFAYRKGDFLRMEFTCTETPKGLKVHVGPHQGSYAPWWTSLQVEVYGSTAGGGRAAVAGSAEAVQSSFDAAHHVAAFTLPDNGRGEDLQIEWAQ